MKTLKLTLAAAALGTLVALPITSAHAWGNRGPPGVTVVTTMTGVMAGAATRAMHLMARPLLHQLHPLQASSNHLASACVV